MAIPEPKPGLVLRYDYLWTHEAAAGQDQGKDRPACLVAATDALVRPRHVVLLPITHTPPSGDTVGIEIPAKVKQAIGLDDAPSWVIVSKASKAGLGRNVSAAVFTAFCSRGV